MSLFNESVFSSAGGGDIIPIVKYDARSGRMSRSDYVGGERTAVDITRSFKAVFDFENIETGHIDFSTGGAPSFAVARYGSPIPAAPSQNHKPGFRVLVYLSKECGGDLREFASTAKACLKGINQLFTAYQQGVKQNPNKLPVVSLDDTVAIVTGEGAKKSTAYSPVFTIQKWVDRPAGLVYTPRAYAAPVPAASAPTAAKAAAPELTGFEDEDDFG